MNVPPEVLETLEQWVRKAESDFKAATYLLKVHAEEGSLDVVCFHAQQCAEKYVKAILILRGIDFGKTHDLIELSRSLPSSDPMPIGSHECGQLSSYAVAGRYPSDSEITLQDANQAKNWMDKIRNWARALLPKAALS